VAGEIMPGASLIGRCEGRGDEAARFGPPRPRPAALAPHGPLPLFNPSLPPSSLLSFSPSHPHFSSSVPSRLSSSLSSHSRLTLVSLSSHSRLTLVSLSSSVFTSPPSLLVDIVAARLTIGPAISSLCLHDLHERQKNRSRTLHTMGERIVARLLALALLFLCLPSPIHAATCFGAGGSSYNNQVQCTNSDVCCTSQSACMPNKLCADAGPATGQTFVRGACTQNPYSLDTCSPLCLYSKWTAYHDSRVLTDPVRRDDSGRPAAARESVWRWQLLLQRRRRLLRG
jgi:hypothetical protein